MNIALTKNAYKIYGQNKTIPKGELSLKDISNKRNVYLVPADTPYVQVRNFPSGTLFITNNSVNETRFNIYDNEIGTEYNFINMANNTLMQIHPTENITILYTRMSSDFSFSNYEITVDSNYWIEPATSYTLITLTKLTDNYWLANGPILFREND